MYSPEKGKILPGKLTNRAKSAIMELLQGDSDGKGERPMDMFERTRRLIGAEALETLDTTRA